jgi:hypothetical protein
VDQAGLAGGSYCVLAVNLAGVETGEACVGVGQRRTLMPMIVR